MRSQSISEIMARSVEKENLFIEIFYLSGDDPFIFGVNGRVTVAELNSILSDAQDSELFDHGDGDYLCAASYNEAQTGEYGVIEIPAYWELSVLHFEPIPLQEEGRKYPVSSWTRGLVPA